MGIIIAIITVAVGSVVGLAMVSATSTVAQGLNISTIANTTLNNTLGTIYSSWPLLGLVVLALIGGAVIGAITFFG
jgi:hypothetical protein